MNWTRAVLLVVVVIAGATISLLGARILTNQPCDVNGSFDKLLCYWDAKSSAYYSYNEFRKPKCGDYVLAAVNITKFNVPARYYACISALYMNGTSDYSGDINSIYVDKPSSTLFACSPSIYSATDSHGASQNGYVPNITGKHVFLAVYVYDANVAANYTLNDFMRNANSANRIASLEGSVTC